MVLQGIASCIDDAPNMNLIAKAGDATSLLALPELRSCDVLILDINLPDLNGIDAIASVLQKNSDLKVLIFSIHRGVEYARKSLTAGASGYLFKDAMPDELIIATQTVHNGGTYLPTEIAAALATGSPTGTSEKAAPRLTDRELCILTEIAAGHSSKSIAWNIGVSVRTVETHRQNIRQKLGAKSASECVSIALGLGLIS